MSRAVERGPRVTAISSPRSRNAERTLIDVVTGVLVGKAETGEDIGLDIVGLFVEFIVLIVIVIRLASLRSFALCL